MQDSLEDKKNVLEQFQGHLQTLFDWQTELDRLNMIAQSLLETCADTRISNAVTQLTTKYNALLSLAKEIMRRLELHYQEHQQHNSLYGECQDWLERTRDRLNECQDIPNSLSEVQIKLNAVKGIRQSLEQGQNKLRYVLELKEKVIMNTEAQGASKIQEDTENLKQEFEKLLVDTADIRQKLASRAAQLEEIYKIYKSLVEWLDEIEPNVQVSDTFLNDLSEKRASLEKFRTLQRDINSHTEAVEKINTKLEEDKNMNKNDFEDGLNRYSSIQEIVSKNIENLENQVNNHENYKHAFNEIYDWIRKTKMDMQQCSDSHGEKQQTLDKLNKIKEIDLSMPEGKILMETTIEMSESVVQTSGSEGQDVVRQEIKQLKSDWEGLQQISREAHEVLNTCVASWNDFLEKSTNINKWIEVYSAKIKNENDVEKKTPEDLLACKVIILQVNGVTNSLFVTFFFSLFFYLI